MLKKLVFILTFCLSLHAVENQSGDFTALPEEIVQHIMSFVTAPKDFAHLTSTCKRLRASGSSKKAQEGLYVNLKSETALQKFISSPYWHQIRDLTYAGYLPPIQTCFELPSYLPNLETFRSFNDLNHGDFSWMNVHKKLKHITQNGTNSSASSLDTLADSPHLVACTLYNFDHLKDISGLSGLNKIKILDLSSNYDLKSISPIGSLLHLQTLDLSSCGSLEHLTGVETCVNLIKINLHSCGNISNISPLAALRKLQVLIAAETGIDDLTPLRGSMLLKSLDVSATPIRTLDPLAGLPNLEVVKANCCDYLASVEALRTLPNLVCLELAGYDSLDVSPVGECTSLRELVLSNNSEIENLTLLQNLEELRYLDITTCSSLRSIAGVKDLPYLTTLHIQNCEEVVDTSFLVGFPALTRASYFNTPITELTHITLSALMHGKEAYRRMYTYE